MHSESEHPVFDTYRFHLFITDYHFELIKLKCHPFLSRIQSPSLRHLYQQQSIKFTQPSFQKDIIYLTPKTGAVTNCYCYSIDLILLGFLQYLTVHNVLLRNNRFWNKVFLLFFQYAIFFANKNTVEYSKVTLLSM